MLSIFTAEYYSRVLDGVIGIFSPRTALLRQSTRAMARSYDAASKGRRGAGWRSKGKGPKEGLCQLSTLRERSRDLVRNNGYAARSVSGIVSNVIGTGIEFQFRQEERGRSVKRSNEVFKRWSESTFCDFYGLNTFSGLQTLMMRCLVESGEVIIRRQIVSSKESKGQIPLKIQVLEPDFLDDAATTAVEGHQVIAGIEFDSYGRRVAYHLLKTHRSINPFASSVRVPAEEVIHLFRMDRAGQVRGFPWGAPAMLNLHDLDQFEDAELQRRKIAACFAGFVKSPLSDDPIINGMGDSGKLPDLVDRLEPGIIEYLPEGTSVDFAIPPNVTGYDEYAVSMLHKIAAGYGVPYSVATGDFRQVNFSSGRMGWLEFQRSVDEWRWNLVIPNALEKIIDWFDEISAVVGVETRGLKREWTAPRREMIDPVKEGSSLINQIKAGLISPQEAIKQLGYDPQVNLDQFQAWNAELDKRGIVLDTDPRKDAKRMTAENIALSQKSE